MCVRLRSHVHLHTPNPHPLYPNRHSQYHGASDWARARDRCVRRCLMAVLHRSRRPKCQSHRSNIHIQTIQRRARGPDGAVSHVERGRRGWHQRQRPPVGGAAAGGTAGGCVCVYMYSCVSGTRKEGRKEEKKKERKGEADLSPICTHSCLVDHSYLDPDAQKVAQRIQGCVGVCLLVHLSIDRTPFPLSNPYLTHTSLSTSM